MRHVPSVDAMTLSLSVLDLIPVSQGQTSADAVAASMALVEHADRLGVRRYWFAEHHNMASVASTTPPVLIAAAAARTERIRLGSGGVMLPNHSPFVVAEQFAALEALAPGRIDLGLGRAPGSDQVIAALLRSSGPTADVERFPEHIETIRALLGTDGAAIALRDKTYELRATPRPTSAPTVWLLGSSDFSAALAARLGLPYVFAHHFAGTGTAEAIERYRSEYQPSDEHPAPHTFLTANVVVDPDPDEARARAEPNLQQMARLRTGRPLTALDRVETALDEDLDPVRARLIDAMAQRWLIGTPGDVASRLHGLAEEFGADEVMVSIGAGLRRGERADRAEARERSLELLVDALA